MKITERQFQALVQCGGIALAICVVANLYLVLRYRELYRDRVQTELRFQQLATGTVLAQRQAFESVLREFIPRAAQDAKVGEILQRHQILGGLTSTGTNQGTEARP
jgi:hypothetical protein